MPEGPLIRVVVADSDPEVQARFIALLAGLPDVGVPVAVATVDDLVDRLRAGRADVVLLAEELGGVDGLELCSRLGLQHPHVKFLFTASDPPLDTILLALEVGAAGVVVRERGPDNGMNRRRDISGTLIEAAIRSIRLGGTYLDPRVAERVISAAVEAGEDKSVGNGHV